MDLPQAIMRIQQLDEDFAKAAVLCIQQNKEAAIPELLAILHRVVDTADSILDPDVEDIEVTYVLHLLAEFGVYEAFEPMIQLLSLEDEACDWLLGELITEGMGRIIGTLATDRDIDRIKSVVENDTLDDFQRTAALKALIVMYVDGRYSREAIVDYLGHLLHKYEDTGEFVTWIICECKNVGAVEHYERIRNLFKEDKVEEAIISDDDFSADKMHITEEEALVKLKERLENGTITNTIEALDYWMRHTEKEQRSKLGRNDRCYCGSGLKFKRCCLNMA